MDLPTHCLSHLPFNHTSLQLRRKQFCQLGLLLREIAGDVHAPGVLPDEEAVKDEDAPAATLDAPLSDTMPQPMDE